MSAKQQRRRRAEAILSQPYIAAITRAVASGGLPVLPGTLAHLFVAHDATCPRPDGGLCNCQPELELRYEGA